VRAGSAAPRQSLSAVAGRDLHRVGRIFKLLWLGLMLFFGLSERGGKPAGVGIVFGEIGSRPLPSWGGVGQVFSLSVSRRVRRAASFSAWFESPRCA